MNTHLEQLIESKSQPLPLLGCYSPSSPRAKHKAIWVWPFCPRATQTLHIGQCIGSIGNPANPTPVSTYKLPLLLQLAGNLSQVKQPRAMITMGTEGNKGFFIPPIQLSLCCIVSCIKRVFRPDKSGRCEAVQDPVPDLSDLSYLLGRQTLKLPP